MDKPPPKKTSLEKLAARIDLGNQIAGILEDSAKTAHTGFRHELLALASRLRVCNHAGNSWHIKDAKTVIQMDCTGAEQPPAEKPFDAIGRFWRCGSKLCPDCLARQSRISRKKLREAIHVQQPKKGDRYYFATFTIPNPDLSLLETRSIVNRAWTLFRKRKMCVALIRGGVKSEEFTVTSQGFHYHLHCLFLSKFILFNELRRVWTECVETAFEEHDRPFEVNNKDGMLRVVIKTTQPNESCVQEICKYITKADSWQKLRPQDLTEVALIRQWSRMFELFGSFRSLPSAVASTDEPIVHTRSLSDGGSEPSPTYWRDRIGQMSLQDYRLELLDDLDRTKAGRLRQLELRYLGCRIETYEEIIDKGRQPFENDDEQRITTLSNLGVTVKRNDSRNPSDIVS